MDVPLEKLRKLLNGESCLCVMERKQSAAAHIDALQKLGKMPRHNLILMFDSDGARMGTPTLLECRELPSATHTAQWAVQRTFRKTTYADYLANVYGW